jgi:molecular chaperone GrpE
MTHSPDRPFDDDRSPAEDLTSEDAYARGASATDDESAAGNAEAAAPMRDGESTSGAAALGGDNRALEEQRDRFLRLAAEYDNFRKRTTRERAELSARAQAELAKQLLEALDDLSRFSQLDPAATDPVAVVQGVDLVEKKLRKALGGAGLELIDPIDQPFDPSVHEAIATEPAMSPEDDEMVAHVYQPGYRFAGLLLRPARVVVKQWTG